MLGKLNKTHPTITMTSPHLPILAAIATLMTHPVCACGDAPTPPEIRTADDIQSNGTTILHEICRKGGSAKAIRMLIEYGADVNRKEATAKEDTPLILLVRDANTPDLSSVRVLLDNGADPSILNAEGCSALHYARALRHGAIITELENQLQTRLNQALKDDNRDIVPQLISAGADINHADAFNNTPLSSTYFTDNVEQAAFLLSLGANPNLKPMVNGRYDPLPCKQCQKYDNTAMIELLHQHGLDINTQGNLGDRYLIYAANGNILHTRWALNHGADATLTDSQNRSALMAATTAEIARLVLDAAPQMLHHTDNDGNNAMHHAAMKGAVSPNHAAQLWLISHKTPSGATISSHKSGLRATPEQVCRVLHAAGLSVNEINKEGQTALMLAAETGDLTLCRCLLELGADINRLDSENRSALSYAQRSANEELIALLRNCGTPGGAEEELLQAAASGDKDKVSQLLQSQLSIKGKIAFAALEKAVFSEQEEIARLLLERGADIHTKNAAGKLLLQLAIEENNRSATEILLKLGANPHHRGTLANYPSGGNALTTAVGTGNIEMVQLLLERGVKIQQRPHAACPALNLAARLGRADMVNLLLDNGANIHGGEQHFRQTALLSAISAGQAHIVQLLLERGAKPEAANGAALWEAIRKHNPKIVQLLLAAGANANQTDNYNRNILYEAACFNPPEVIDMLIKAGANVNLQATDGIHNSTALINACRHQKQDSAEIVRLLLEAGANASVKDAKGKTALDYATERGHTQAAELLKAH